MSQDDPVIGAVPDLQLAGFLNNAQPLNAYLGRVVVIDFWATWCLPCLAAVPKNNALAEKYAALGAIVYGICATTGSETLEEVVRERGIAYPCARDVDKASERALGVRWFPSFSLIDRNGLLWRANIGPGKIEEALNELLNEQPAH